MLRIRWWPLIAIGVYLIICGVLSLAVLAGAAAGSPYLGEYFPYFHWPLKLLTGG